MDSDENHLGSENYINKESHFGSEILLTENALLELLKKKLCPGYVRDREAVLLTAPWEEGDFRVGVYLYDIQDYSNVHRRLLSK